MKMAPRRALVGAVTLLMLFARTVHAGVPEPDTVVWGSIARDGQFVTADDADVIVEVRAVPGGPVLTSYRMGDSPAAGPRYVLRIKCEHMAPVLESDAVLLGATVYLTVSDRDGVRDETTLTLTTRGRLVQLDFGDVDSDGDGMSDSFEQDHFGSATSGDPNADPDGDGRPNRREFQQDTDPLVADGRHPADIAPADDALTITEVTDYALAWQIGEAWSIEPTNIPIAYVTRSGALWKGGESYIFDNEPPTNAPNWWVNPPLGALMPASVGDLPMELSATRTAPSRYSNGVPFVVTIAVQPLETVKAYALEERVPEGWSTSSMSHGGQFDRVNRKLKWGPFFDAQPRQVSYRVTPAAVESELIRFDGTASFDGLDVEIAGQTSTVTGVVRPHLAVLRTGSLVMIRLRGAASARYVIETSDDLLHWTPWTTVTTDAVGSLELSASTQGSARYYRARTEQ